MARVSDRASRSPEGIERGDNLSSCESFIKTLKDEEVYLWEYKTMQDAERRICHFIKDMYDGYCQKYDEKGVEI